MIAEAQFDRSTLGCMIALRRRLKQATGVTVSLADPDAVEHLIDLSVTCEEDDVRELGARLAEMVVYQQGTEAATPASRSLIATMRERLNTHPMEQPGQTRLTVADHGATASVRIYRGQIVRG
ncbi:MULTISPECIES: hypothetical protein [Pseudomonas]|uniref:hypothetical protein n=1 Tax=Pseudomonas TaxID=286 RepID=UPI001239A54E|nr:MULTISPECIES: hypothetical protein [Pseudomonas]QIB50975.1 hypothetical protein G3M63_07900 [Pseudomonas sp. OIL-1]